MVKDDDSPACAVLEGPHVHVVHAVQLLLAHACMVGHGLEQLELGHIPMSRAQIIQVPHVHGMHAVQLLLLARTSRMPLIQRQQPCPQAGGRTPSE